MEFEQAKNLLKKLARKRKLVDVIGQRIAMFKSDYSAIRSSLAGEIIGGGKMNSKVELLAEKVLKEESKYIKALEDYFAIEDSIANALDTLTEEEREIIVEYYMQGYPERKIARIMNYSERSIRYIKAKAITKISKKL